MIPASAAVPSIALPLVDWAGTPAKVWVVFTMIHELNGTVVTKKALSAVARTTQVTRATPTLVASPAKRPFF